MEKTVTTTTTKGLVLGLILIVIGMAIYFSGMDMNGPIKWLGYVAFIAGIIFSIVIYGRQINYASTFGDYFAHGFKVSAIVTIMMIAYIVIFILLFPEMKEKAMDEARKNMQLQNLSEDKINQALDISRRFFMPFVIGFTLIAYVFSGVIASLIGAAVTKKNPENFHQIDQIA